MTRPTMTLADAEAQAAAFLAARQSRHGDLRMEDTGGTDGNPTGGTDGGQPDDQPGDAPQETPDEKAARLEAELAEAKRHSRKWEGLAKDNKDAARKLADIEAQNATPDQRLAAAEKRAGDAETELARYKVAHETQLPASLLSLLNGDEDTMRAQAKALLEFKGTPPARRTPAPDPTQGGTGGNKVSAADEGKAEAQRRIAARKK